MRNNKLTIGKIRGLAATANPSGVFTILAFDHRQSFVRMLNPSAPDNVTYAEIVNAKLEVVKILGPHASAVLLDPEFGGAQSIASYSLPGSTGLILALEETGYQGKSDYRISAVLQNWSVAKAKRMGGEAVKLLVYYHPHAGEVTDKQDQLIKEVVKTCADEDILLFLEPVSYSIDSSVEKDSKAFAEQRPKLIRDIASRLGELEPDVLKLEFPVDANYEADEAVWFEACEMVSDAAGCPWTVLSAGVSFETFSRQVEVACRAGASGFIAGRAVWKGGFEVPPHEREAWFLNEGVQRLEQLKEIVTHQAVPFWAHYPPQDHGAFEGWYGQY